jgi:hypothetical protein
MCTRDEQILTGSTDVQNVKGPICCAYDGPQKCSSKPANDSHYRC